MAIDCVQEEPKPKGAAVGPLSGLRVLDLTTILLGPFATQILGDMGADVIKIEAPGGDPIRHVGPPPADGMGAVFLGANRNKRSIVMDLKQTDTKEVFYRLVEVADIVVHNMRSQAAQRLGIDYQTLRGYKADIVFLDLQGINWVPFNDPTNQMVHTEDGSSVRNVMIGGQMVVQDRLPVNIDLRSLKKKAEAAEKETGTR